MNEKDVLSFLISVFLGGFIGWITNWIAVKALFLPYKPVRILFWEFQGLLPKRQKELGENLGKVVEGELIDIKELIKSIDEKDIAMVIDEQIHSNRVKAEEKVKNSINAIIKKLPFVSFNAEKLSKPLMDKIEKEVGQSLKKQIPGLLDKAAEKAAEKISVKTIVKEKIQNMDMHKLEEIINRISAKEMKAIIRLGGVLGIIVGAVHWALIHFLRV